MTQDFIFKKKLNFECQMASGMNDWTMNDQTIIIKQYDQWGQVNLSMVDR